ncbi:MAG: PHP domain-containing protein [Archaeoglobaceae archaeon]|nr:PHP domain-containing protein [Archaeoglobaceae archaeon]MCX8152139.1 PHP domain-containing protein [Archaeoglobaceae archaeon]MDW8013575.1 PHP domain-containing protein [Archaeoglobaceae archaeon]
MLLAELHVHTTYSDGKDNVKRVLTAALDKRIDVIAITDHDCIEGSLEAEKIVLEEHLPIKVITASEITTENGHIIAYGIKKDIESKMSLKETCKEVRKAGGLSFLAHPFDIFRGGTVRLSSFNFVDGVEVLNARSFFNFLAKRYAIKFKKPGIGGSDAHSAEEVGKVLNLLKNSEVNSLLSSIVWSNMTSNCLNYYVL